MASFEPTCLDVGAFGRDLLRQRHRNLRLDTISRLSAIDWPRFSFRSSHASHRLEAVVPFALNVIRLISSKAKLHIFVSKLYNLNVQLNELAKSGK